MSVSHWLRDGEPSLEEQGNAKLREDVAKTRLHSRGIGHLALDPERARRELTEEQRALRGSRPHNRRWKALDKLDREIDRLTQRHADAAAQLHEAGQALDRAPEVDAATLADWLAAGERGERPAASLYERQRERDAAQLLVDATAVERDHALERRLEHVERHRAKMLADARKDVDGSQRRLLEKIGELPALRDNLAAARETLLWVAAYPDQAESWGHPSAVALGLRKPVEQTLGTRARVDYGAFALRWRRTLPPSPARSAVSSRRGSVSPGRRRRSTGRFGTEIRITSPGRRPSLRGLAGWPSGTTRRRSPPRSGTSGHEHPGPIPRRPWGGLPSHNGRCRRYPVIPCPAAVLPFF